MTKNSENTSSIFPFILISMISVNFHKTNGTGALYNWLLYSRDMGLMLHNYKRFIKGFACMNKNVIARVKAEALFFGIRLDHTRTHARTHARMHTRTHTLTRSVYVPAP